MRRLSKPLTGLSAPDVASVATFTIEPLLEFDLRDWPGRMQVDPLAPDAPDPTPTPDPGGSAWFPRR